MTTLPFKTQYPELNDCANCGGEAYLDSAEIRVNKFDRPQFEWMKFITCLDCQIRTDYFEPTQEELEKHIKIWNTRHTPAIEQNQFRNKIK